MTATAVAPVSAEPAQILVAVNTSARCCRPITFARRFAVNFLSEANADLADLFSRSGLDQEVRFTSGDWRTNITGAPILADCVASFDCGLVDAHRHGTHSIFVGQVLSIDSKREPPLIYRNGAYVLNDTRRIGRPKRRSALSRRT